MLEGRDQLLLQLVDVQLARVDDQVGLLAHRLDALTLMLDRFEQALGVVGEGMPATGGVVALHEHRSLARAGKALDQ